ncbi:Phosphatidylserine decarboxylase [Lutibaculum baratangense AMV1]|uniref:Phosphatidylserine decarboxylase proenzyme n=2 Tax=Lutibaculum TaxID=1358438 RepID=V4RC32_9HYPH|nr:Phosphatidylserine decarboxylase [Lutibaculum baratangense AMV1]
MIRSLRNGMVPIHREGYPFIAIGVIITVALWVFGTWVGWIFALITAWVTYFFRDPPRVTPVHPDLVVSGADGRISSVSRAVPPPELDLGTEPLPRVCVFMNVVNVHVNRAPVAGRIERIVYTPGKFVNAELDKASEDNERNALVLETQEGRLVGVVQIAGLVARRIVSFVQEGGRLEPGQRIGLIRFGSRVDHYLPEDAEILCQVGQTATAGETVIARLGSGAGHPAPVRWRSD